MTYIPEARIEARASELLRRHALEPGFDVERLIDDLGLGLVWEAVDDDCDGVVLGQLVPQQHLVVLNERHLDRLEENGGRQRRFTVGHEVGHWVLHAEAVRSGTLSLFEGERIWCRDGSSDPIERQAEMFSAALLVPRDGLISALLKQPWHGWSLVYRLSDTFLVTVTAMAIRLERLDWIHRDDEGFPVSGPKPTAGQATLFD